MTVRITNPMNRALIELTHSRIEVHRFREHISDPDVGAHAWFEGVTRRLTQVAETTQQTQELSYEAFEPMAIAELQRIGDETIAEFELSALVIVHRLGTVPIGEASLLVGCSSAHRAAVFAALPKVVNRLKADVPIWKKELFVDGSTQWVHPT
jgi:molybdopterin synthase catalytic subunit